MSEAKTTAGDAVVQLGFKDGDYIQEFGYDEDVDLDLREGIEDLIGSDLLDEEDQEVGDLGSAPFLEPFGLHPRRGGCARTATSARNQTPSRPPLPAPGYRERKNGPVSPGRPDCGSPPAHPSTSRSPERWPGPDPCRCTGVSRWNRVG